MEKIKKKLYQMPLKKALIFIFTVFIVSISILTGITIFVSVKIQRDVLETRTFMFVANEGNITQDGSFSYYMNDQYEWSPLSTEQKVLYYGSVLAMILLPIIYVITGILLSVAFYYQVKLKKPLWLLTNSIKNVSQGNLDFEMSYYSGDEMGKLCGAVERMKNELLKDKKHIWELLEERRALNASISHDLGTPITVLKGYLEFLSKNVPKQKVQEKNLMETLGYMTEAVWRLERYIECVRGVDKLSEIEILPQQESFEKVQKEMQSNFLNLAKEYDRKLIFHGEYKEEVIKIDKQILFRIMENIMENAFRYAKEAIHVYINLNKEWLALCVVDDGVGFSNDALDSATSIFYTTKDHKNNLGLGLHISKMLCRKHGGKLKISNEKNKGGRVSITIKISDGI